jgi:hypothetical protein
LLVFVTALAFVLQSFIAQTHIHTSPQGLGDIVKSVTTLSHSQGKKPADDNARDCPFCQAVVHAGAFVAPTPPLLVLPGLSEAISQAVKLGAVISLAAHNWQSRAPPQR